MRFYATDETLAKVKALVDKELVNKDGEKGHIGYIMKISPFEADHLNGGNIVTVIADDKTEYSYRGEEGLQELLATWEGK